MMRQLVPQKWRLMPLLMVLLLGGCAGIRPDFEQPTVQLVSLQTLASRGLEQRFELGLRIANPNGVRLNLKGLEYVITLEDYPLVSGLAANIAPIPAYGDGLVNVQASVSLLQGARLLLQLLENPKPQLSYVINAKLDTGLPIIGKIVVTNRGDVALTKP